ncbi:MAG: flagellin lysine-N-methylase [Clostridia bacterium]|nr:flagellin lysine-N-methylase [Clostridia bacterium]
MKLYAPSYYKKFKCIADKCEHSCCIGWEIDIDEVTLKKYEKLKNGYAPAIKESISLKETPHFKLCEGDRCPHLDEAGLCKIISNVGEDYLCDICREHPRFYNFTSVCEVGIGMSCTEAARIILSSPEYDSIEKIGKVDAIKTGASFDGRAERGKLYSILKEHSEPYDKRLDEIRKSYLIPSREDIYYLKIIDSLEYLDESHKTLFMNYSSNCRPEGKDEYLERFLAYFIYRHTTESFDSEDFSARLSFCLFCERLFASLICRTNAESLEDLSTLARIISEEIEYSEDNTASLTY